MPSIRCFSFFLFYFLIWSNSMYEIIWTKKVILREFFLLRFLPAILNNFRIQHVYCAVNIVCWFGSLAWKDSRFIKWYFRFLCLAFFNTHVEMIVATRFIRMICIIHFWFCFCFIIELSAIFSANKRNQLYMPIINFWMKSLCINAFFQWKKTVLLEKVSKYSYRRCV